jgi:hypothetical protein
MKIDPINKTLHLDAGDNLGQVVFALKELYPNGEWEQYKIVQGHSYNQPWITYDGTVTDPLPYYTYTTNCSVDSANQPIGNWTPFGPNKV